MTDARGINNILISHDIPELIYNALALHISLENKEVVKSILTLLNNLLAHTSSMGRIHVSICIDYNIHTLLSTIFDKFKVEEDTNLLLYTALCLSPLIQGVNEDKLSSTLGNITNIIKYFISNSKDNKDIMCEIAKMVLLLTSKSEPAKIELRDSGIFHSLLELCLTYIDCERYIYLFMECWQNISNIISIN